MDPVSARQRWTDERARMEAGDEKHTPDGRRRHRHWSLFKLCLMMFDVLLKVTGLHGRGVRNALDIELREVSLTLDRLPAALDGYRILQISDPHFDAMPELTERMTRLVETADADICVLTGDYRFRVHGDFDGVRDALSKLVPTLACPDGVVAILGNHDSVDMVPMFEALGVRVLVNQTISLPRNGHVLHITGVDDAHYYFTDRAVDALRDAPSGFRVALAHSPELVAHAADAGLDLYLTGHTHGGQICLPGGRAIITHSVTDRRYTSGLWREKQMIGYTSRGAGVSGLPVRFNCRGEITIFTLRSTGA